MSTEMAVAAAAPSETTDAASTIPWTVDPVAAAPKQVVAACKATAGSSGEGSQRVNPGMLLSVSDHKWHCVYQAGSQDDGSSSSSSGSTISSHRAGSIHVWYNATSSMKDQIHSTNVAILTHPSFATTATGAPSAPLLVPLLAMVTGPTPNTCYVYAAVAHWLLVWKLTPQDCRVNHNNNHGSSTGSTSHSVPHPRPTAVHKLWDPHEDDNGQGNAVEVEEDSSRHLTKHHDASNTHRPEHCSALSATWSTSCPVLWVGTEPRNRVYFVTQNAVPVTLRSVLVAPAPPSSLVGRLWNTVVYHPHHETHGAVAALTPYDGGVVACTRSGHWTQWSRRSDTTSVSLSFSFDVVRTVSLADSSGGLDRPALEGVDDLTVLKAVLVENQWWHAIVRLVAQGNEKEEDNVRLEWIVIPFGEEAAPPADTPDGTSFTAPTRRVWLNRFVSPLTVEVTNLCVASNGTVYASFAQDTSLAPTVMAWPHDEHLNCKTATGVSGARTRSRPQQHVVEVDLVNTPRIVSDSMTADKVTHGVTVLDACGVWLRVRLVLPANPSLTAAAAVTDRDDGVDVAVVRATLVTHLMSVVSDAYAYPQRTVLFPPSLTTATPADLEATVVTVGLQLQQPPSGKGVGYGLSSSHAHSPLQRHLAYIEVLKDGGVYRNLSAVNKWSLLAIGQEVAVAYKMSQMKSSLSADDLAQNSWQPPPIAPFGVGDWLTRCQEHALSYRASSKDHQLWLQWLTCAMGAAMDYREERAVVTYDVEPNQVAQQGGGTETTIPVWTSAPIVQALLVRQLVYWCEEDTSLASKDTIYNVIQYALQSLGDSFLSGQGQFMEDREKIKNAYVLAQKQSFEIVRKATGHDGDAFLYELSIAHSIFWGLCELDMFHERRKDKKDYSLTPLFADVAHKEDAETGMRFDTYVLKWHTDRKHFGHVMEYGRQCPNTLSQLLNNVEALAPFRWIYHVQRGDYNMAAESLCDQSTKANSLGETTQKLCMAHMANTVVASESTTLQDKAAKRRRFVNKKRELANAQLDLFPQMDTSVMTLRDPQELLQAALLKFDQADVNKARVHALCLALAVCNSFETHEDVNAGALLIWYKAILIDMNLWKDWLKKESNLASPHLRKEVLSRTVFGGLLEQSQQKGWEDVTYAAVESSTFFEKLGGLHEIFANKRMQRLLSGVTSSAHNMDTRFGRQDLRV